MAVSEEIVPLDLALKARAGDGAGSRRGMTTNKTTTDGPISPRLRRRRQDQGGDRYRDRFFGGVKGDVKGNDEVDFDDFGDPHPPTHLDFLTLTAAVKRIIGSGSAIATPDGQPHRPDLLCRRIVIIAPTPPPPPPPSPSLSGLVPPPPPFYTRILHIPITFIFKFFHSYIHRVKGCVENRGGSRQ